MGDPPTMACENEVLLTGDTGKMDMLRAQLRIMDSNAVEKDGTVYFPQKYADPGAVKEYYVHEGRFLIDEAAQTANPEYSRLLEKDGWYEFQPIYPVCPTHLWFISRDPADKEFLTKIRNHQTRDWECINEGYSKYQGGQDPMWVNYLSGGLEDFPEIIMRHNLKQFYGRMEFIYADEETGYGDWYLQARNPVNVEGLVQLTMGGPMPLYNGGLLNVSVCYYDIDRERMGLPEDVAALVSGIDGDGIDLTLLNLNPIKTRRMYVQGGAFGEHNFSKCITDGQETVINDKKFQLTLKPATVIKMRLEMDRYSNRPAYQWPFTGGDYVKDEK
jgi:hypothetical protein